MKVSLIVPAFNEAKLLPATLRCLQSAAAALHDRGWQTELIVCNNNSTDDTAAVAAAAGARVVFEPINQIARARNCGAAAATGDWLVFVDADSSPTAGLFGEMADTIVTGRCVGGGSTIIFDRHYHLAAVANRLWNWFSQRLRYAAGSFVFVEAKAFREVGGFSLKLYASEEIDFSQRLKRLGRKTKRQVCILHRHPMITSSRKMELYSPWEHFKFIARAILGGGRSLRRPEQCSLWYDGRR
jgi:glycosyltransferase involved in cell wall biosynthesis